MFGFADSRRKRSWLPHVLFAAVETAIVIFSRTESKPTAIERLGQ